MIRVSKIPSYCMRTAGFLLLMLSVTMTGAREVKASEFTRIAQCESGGHQFDSHGKVIINKKGKTNAVGRFQFKLGWHLEAARQLGFNLFTEQGNTAYALYLYKREGHTPWLASRNCWDLALLQKHRHKVALRRFASK